MAFRTSMDRALRTEQGHALFVSLRSQDQLGEQQTNWEFNRENQRSESRKG